MPIWFELLVMALVTYAVALCLGWLIWSRASGDDGSKVPDKEETGN